MPPNAPLLNFPAPPEDPRMTVARRRMWRAILAQLEQATAAHERGEAIGIFADILRGAA